MSPETIRQKRESLGLTAGRAAFYFGVDDRTWRRWEAGTLDISKPVALLLTVCAAVPQAWEHLKSIVNKSSE